MVHYPDHEGRFQEGDKLDLTMVGGHVLPAIVEGRTDELKMGPAVRLRVVMHFTDLQPRHESVKR